MGSFFKIKPRRKGRIHNIKASALGTPEEVSRIRFIMAVFGGTIDGVFHVEPKEE